MTNPPGHLWRDKWTALSGPFSEGRDEIVRRDVFQRQKLPSLVPSLAQAPNPLPPKPQHPNFNTPKHETRNTKTLVRCLLCARELGAMSQHESHFVNVCFFVYLYNW